MNKRKYWILTTITECIVCGRGSTEKERQYTPKPKEYSKRRIRIFRYDYCNSL